MKTSIILYTNPKYPLTDKIRKHYPGLKSTTPYLIVEFLHNNVFNLYGLNSYRLTQRYNEVYYDKYKLDISLVHPLEIQYLNEKFKGKKDYEDYTKVTIEYLKNTSRLTANDYNYFMNRLKWTYDVVKVEDSYGYFDFNTVPLSWGALPNQDSLIFIGKEDEIIEIYSGYNKEDEYLYETIVDKTQLNISKIESNYLKQFKQFVFREKQ